MLELGAEEGTHAKNSFLSVLLLVVVSNGCIYLETWGT
jgi:hypothetical protein